MAPVPEDNQDNPSHGGKEDDLTSHANPTTMLPLDVADSSEEEGEDTPYSGYSLLPQDAGDTDSDGGEELAQNYQQPSPAEGVGSPTYGPSTLPDVMPEVVLSSEAGAVGPTVHASQASYHPDFLAKFPDGKIPSYMQVPSVPSDRGDMLWNQSRPENTGSSFDSVEENQILRAMSGFRLPSENIPDWAKSLPEDQWRAQVLSRIKKQERQDHRVWADLTRPATASDQWTRPTTASDQWTRPATASDQWTRPTTARDQWTANFKDCN